MDDAEFDTIKCGPRHARLARIYRDLHTRVVERDAADRLRVPKSTVHRWKRELANDELIKAPSASHARVVLTDRGRAWLDRMDSGALVGHWGQGYCPRCGKRV